MEKIDDTFRLYDLKWSDQFLVDWWFKQLPLSLRKLPLSQVAQILPKKKHISDRFAQRLKRSLDGDLWFIVQDLDLLQEKIKGLPNLVPKCPAAKRAFKYWQRSVRNHPLSLEKNQEHYPKVLHALFKSPNITDEEKETIETALTFVSKGIGAIVKQLSKKFKVEDTWRLPNGKLMLFGSDFNVGPDDKNEDKNFSTLWIDRIADTRPTDSKGIAEQDLFNRFDLTDLIRKHAPLTRLERQILLLKCKEDIPLKEIAKELGKPLKSVSNAYYNARKKMDKWLQRIGMKGILQDEQLQRDHFLFTTPPHKTVKLPSLWDDDSGKTPSPVKAWFEQDHGQDFLLSLIPNDDETPWCW